MQEPVTDVADNSGRDPATGMLGRKAARLLTECADTAADRGVACPGADERAGDARIPLAAPRAL